MGSLCKYRSYSSSKLSGRSFLGLPNFTPFYLAAAIPSACRCFI
nr:MAG TPA: hypothetical protein [Caudoviricetes sp.]